jgi:hypothetical protein
MEKKLAPYANGFNILVNKDTGEAIITFVQNQPGFNPENGKMDVQGSTEVSTVVMPFNLANQLSNILRECIDHEMKAKNNG